MSGPIEVNPQDYTDILTSQPPMPIPPGPVHSGGLTPADLAAAAFGAATNADVPENNSQLADDHTDRTGHAASALDKFGANEDDAVSQFADVAAGETSVADRAPMDAMGGATQAITSALQGITGALGGVLSSAAQLPQGLMQAGQAALSPLMSAAQSLGNGALDGTSLASDISPGSALGGSDLGGAGVGGLGSGTTPASDLGPPPVPGTTTPTTPASSLGTSSSSGPRSGGAPAAAANGGGMMPMMPGGGAGGGKVGNDDKAAEKRIVAPSVPNGQPVKGRVTSTPNVPVTRSAAKDDGPQAIRVLKRIADHDEPSR